MRLGNSRHARRAAARAALVLVGVAALVVPVGGPAPPAGAQVAPSASPTSVDLSSIGDFEDIIIDPATGNLVVSGVDGVVLLDDQIQVLDQLTLPGADGLAIDGDDLWIAQRSESAISRVDLATLDVEQTYPAGTTVHGSIAVVGGAVWFTGNLDGSRNYLFRLDPATGDVSDRGGRTYQGRLSTIPGSDTHVLLHDRGVSPYSVYRTDLTQNPVEQEDDVPHGSGSNLREVAVSERNTFVTASGAPYSFREFSLATMEPTGTVYAATNYPSGIAFGSAFGGLYAGTTQSSHQLFVYLDGHQAPLYRFSAGTELSYAAVELAVDGSAAYVVSSSNQLLRFQLEAHIDGLEPDAVEAGVESTMAVEGGGLQLATDVMVDGEPVPFEVDDQLLVDMPDSLVPGEHEIQVSTPHGSPTATFVASHRPAAPAAPNAVALDRGARVLVGGTGDDDLPILHYEVRVSPGTSTCDANPGSSCNLYSLVNGEPYRFSMRAVNAVGPGEWSAWSDEVVPYGRPGVPAPPTLEHDSGSVEITVGGADGNGATITSYDVQGEQPDSGSCTTDASGTCTIDELDPTVEHRYRARARSAGGTGSWSGWSEPVRPSRCPGGGGPFPDVGGGHPFCSEIEWLMVRGITQGYSDGTFRPGAVISRMSMAAQLHRAEGEPAFALPDDRSYPDVPRDHPFFLPIEWTHSVGVTSGYEDGTFRPSRPISRAAMAAMLHRLAGSPEVLVSRQTFTDVSPAHPFFEEIEWLAGEGISTGFADGSFQSTQPVTRQAMAAFLLRWSNRA